MDDFKNFLEENNYKDDLEFQLCDLEMAFNAGKELQWKPSDEQIGLLQAIVNDPNNASSESCQIVLKEVIRQLKKLREE